MGALSEVSATKPGTASEELEPFYDGRNLDSSRRSCRTGIWKSSGTKIWPGLCNVGAFRNVRSSKRRRVAICAFKTTYFLNVSLSGCTQATFLSAIAHMLVPLPPEFRGFSRAVQGIILQILSMWHSRVKFPC